MLDHYFTFGGNEVGNSERAYRYAQSADCNVEWLEDPRTDAVITAVGDDPYDIENIDQAPWYDIDDPDVTGRFYGLYMVDMRGLGDSTRQAIVTQKNGAGAQVSGYRHASREVRVRAYLTARGMDALEAGMTWLRNVLEPDACGMHGGACGTSEMEFFVANPPDLGLVRSYGAWVERRRNLFSDPRGLSTSSAFWGTPAGGAGSLVTDLPPGIVTAYRWTASSTSAGAIRQIAGASMPTGASAKVHYVALMRASAPVTVNIYARPNVAATTNQVLLGTVNLIAGLNTVDLTAAAYTAASGASSGVVISPAGTYPNGMTVDVTQSLIELSGEGIGFFDGNLEAPNDLTQYTWLGTVGASQSVLSTRPYVDEPEADVAYQARVDAYRRYLHDVTCTSGPFPVEEMESRDKEHYGRLVEFTLTAEVPFVYGKTKQIEIAPTTPSVIEDTPFNLVTHPSAELASGSIVAATNYSTNPSLETNATNHAGSAVTNTGSSPASYFTSGRVTGELQAIGTASFRTRILGNGSTSAAGRSYMYDTHSVTLSGLANGTRMSFSIWAALVSVGGSTGMTLHGILVDVQWRSGTTVLQTDTIGSTTTPADFGGKVFSAKSILKPNAADNVQIRVRYDVTWSSSATPASNSDVRGYADAFAVTTP